MAPDVLAECGRTMVTPLLAATGRRPPPAPRRDEATRVASRWPAVREGIVHYLTAMAGRDPAEAAAGMSGLTGELLAEQDIPAESPILVPYLIHPGLRRHERPAAILSDLEGGVITEADDPLLAMLWPGRLRGCGGGPAR